MSERSRVSVSWFAYALVVAMCFALGPSCLERRSEPSAGVDSRCATCHGDPARAGDYLSRSAPPRDLSGASSGKYPGVGAHATHLYASASHGAVACNECHVVPERTGSLGHADSARPAEVVFGALAKTAGRTPEYDPVARTCSDSWCHREHADAVWTEARSSQAACGSCHGLPPALPHPQSAQCEACHGAVTDATRHFIAPALHVDGTVQVNAGACNACHGTAEDPAPPRDTLGNQASAAIGVGAHRVHLAGGAFSRPLACSECHTVPKAADDAGHIQGLPARVMLVGVAETGKRRPLWDPASASCSNSWCHGPNENQQHASPSWVSSQSLSCTSCHGAPPPAPHPQLSDCSHCHGAVVAADNETIIDRARHVNGVVDVDFDTSCTSCHGGTNPAPPRDLAGHSAATFSGVGAHQAHLATGSRSRVVLCADCHVVPRSVNDPGHLDSALPAELSFSDVANAFGGSASYANGACSETACHGGKFLGTHRSGGSNVRPQWTKVDGAQATCGSCHSLPPPAPHPYQNDCSSCHEDIAKDNLSFVRPELHVDGNVTFTVP